MGPTPQPSSTIPQPQQNNHCSCNLWAIVLLLNTIVGTEQVNYSLSFSTHRRLSPLLTINLWLAISQLQHYALFLANTLYYFLETSSANMDSPAFQTVSMILRDIIAAVIGSVVA